MNPLTKVKLISELNQREAELGVKDSVSWHSVYKDSAWIFVGGFPYELTEGDIICVFSQYGEISNINLVRDKKTGKSKGFCFICYEDQRSTILAVDNFNGIKIKGRTIRVDHVQNYRPPKDTDDIDEVTKRLREEGCAPRMACSSSSDSEEEGYAVVVKKQKKEKKEKKKKKDKKKKKAQKEEKKESRGQSPSSPPVQVKREREDPGYEKYAQQRAPVDRLPRSERHGQERSHRDLYDDNRTRDRERQREERDRDREREEREREREWDRNREKGKEDSNREGERRRGRERDEDTGRLRDSERTRREDRHRRWDSDRDRSAKHSRDAEYRRS
ncbi:RNA-binding motif protein, X-linked 2 [Scleropages formosus]|uniref:RNA-binding motif protein, X-linked 2 n=1 Tax=Scleropages formosus TaxID=113540 RepID=UPI0008791705|nr:RNA-binding motif protein, X-linked 2 [Scleropages formosus]